MIHHVLSDIKTKLNDYFNTVVEPPGSHVTYPDSGNADALMLVANNVTMLVVNVEEEKMIRQANRYEAGMNKGVKTELKPSIGISILVLFISGFSDYEQSLRFLSMVISFFQKLPVLDHTTSPQLPETIDKITIELTSLPTAQRNEIWGSLKIAYLPSLFYKIGVFIYRDDTPVEAVPGIKKIKIKTKQM